LWASDAQHIAADTLFMQKHWDVMRTDNAGEVMAGSERKPADRFWIVIDVHGT